MSLPVDIHISYDRVWLPLISVTTEGRAKSVPVRISAYDIAFLTELVERCEKQRENVR
jgi:hypothetical protein